MSACLTTELNPYVGTGETDLPLAKRGLPWEIEPIENEVDAEPPLSPPRNRARASLTRSVESEAVEEKVKNWLGMTASRNITTMNHIPTGTLKRERDTDDDAEEEMKPPKKRTMARRLCLVCDRERGINQFPAKRRVSSHNHENDVCRTCFNTHIESVMENSLGGEIPCPQCDESTLSPHEIKSIIHSSSVDKYVPPFL